MRLADVRFEETGRAIVAHVTGEIDLSNAASIGGAIHEEIPNHALLLVFDLSQLDYLDSAGIQLIYQLREDLRIRGQSMLLVVPPRSAAGDTLRLMGLQSHVPAFDTVQDALSGKHVRATTDSDPR